MNTGPKLVTHFFRGGVMMRSAFFQRMIFVVIVLAAGLLYSQEEPDETMPAKIPADIVADWKAQGGTAAEIKKSLPEEYQAKCDGTLESACHWRRVYKMKPFMGDMKKVMYAKHFNFGGAIVGYLEGTKQAQGSEWAVGSGLYILNMNSYYPQPEVLLEDAAGVIKDPCVSSDGSYAVFSWWKKADGGGFHIYEIDLKTKKTKQITNNPVGLEVGDYEPCILPDGDIVFNSSRVFGIIDCAYNVVSNLYLCNRNGEWLRRIGFDQEHTFFPTMMSDGKVLFTRWEYNDRTRISCGGYFTMNPDGSQQMEYWGNQSDFPLMKYQGREIPNSKGKIMGIAGGHLAPYQGEVIVVDPHIDRNRWKENDNKSIKLICPERVPPMDPSTAMDGHDGGVQWIFQNPWPLDENTLLVSWRKSKSDKIFKIYFFESSGSRELISWDSKMSVSQPVVMDAHKTPPLIKQQADYSVDTAVFAVSDVNYGMGAEGIPKGKVAKIRVIALGPFRTNYSMSTGILGFSVIPIGAPFTSWQVKTLLGEIPVAEDGSAAFTVPANRPIYFQTVDKDGRMLNTMRSWSTLMPGERFDCIGCHEDKNAAPPPLQPSETKAKPLIKRLGIEDVHLSFPKHVQPILDKHCVSCHKAGHKSGLDLTANPKFDNGGKRTFNTSYMNLAKTKGKYVDYIDQYEKAAPRTKFPVPGSGTSKLFKKLLDDGHMPDDMTKEELEILMVWNDMMCPHAGSYSEGMSPSDSAAHDKYMADHRYKHAEWEKGNLEKFVEAGQWTNEIYNQTAVNEDAYENRFSEMAKIEKDAAHALRLIRVQGSIVIQCPGAGIISILDLKGRPVMKAIETRESEDGKLSATITGKIPSGLYIIRFKGKALTREQVFSIL